MSRPNEHCGLCFGTGIEVVRGVSMACKCSEEVEHDKRQLKDILKAESVSGEPPRAEPPTCHETHYYCVNHTCDWVGHAKPYERRCPRCGAMVWKEGTDSEFKGKPSPSCLPRAGSRPSAPAPSAAPDLLSLVDQPYPKPTDAEVEKARDWMPVVRRGASGQPERG